MRDARGRGWVRGVRRRERGREGCEEMWRGCEGVGLQKDGREVGFGDHQPSNFALLPPLALLARERRKEALSLFIPLLNTPGWCSWSFQME